MRKKNAPLGGVGSLKSGALRTKIRYCELRTIVALIH